MNINDQIDLIQQYVQWKAIQEVTPRDTSPDAFIRESIRNVAVDRIEQVLDRIAGDERPPLDEVRAILEGTYGERKEDYESVGEKSTEQG